MSGVKCEDWEGVRVTLNDLVVFLLERHRGVLDEFLREGERRVD